MGKEIERERKKEREVRSHIQSSRELEGGSKEIRIPIFFLFFLSVASNVFYAVNNDIDVVLIRDERDTVRHHGYIDIS